MSDCEDFFLSWISPGRKKSKKNKMSTKHKNSISVKTDESIQKKKKKKKKKNAKFKEAMEGRKEKKKGKKKKQPSLGLDESYIFTQSYFASSVLTEKSKPEASHPSITDHLDQDSTKKTKRKKKVAFDLSPEYICVKRPKFPASSPNGNNLPEKEAVTDTGRCSHITKKQHSQSQAHENDSQCTSDDINSQDLFITQKTFRTFPTEPSSGEASDKAVDTTPQKEIQQQETVQRSSVVQIQHDEGPSTHPNPYPQHLKKVQELLLKPKAAQVALTEEEDLDLLQQVELNTNFTEEGRMRGAVHVKPREANHYLDDPIVVKCPMDVTKPYTSSQQSPSRLLNADRPSLPPQASTASISTQTENFFTADLCSYLSFCHKSVCFETLKPLDLSLPRRSRKDPERCLLGKMSETDKENICEQKASSLLKDVKDEGHKDSNLRPSCSSEKKVGECMKKEPAVRQLWRVNTQGKGESTPSPPSESEPKSVDTTSSEDNEPACRTGKLDMTQVRAHEPQHAVHCSDMILKQSFLCYIYRSMHCLKDTSHVASVSKSEMGIICE